MPSLVTLGVVFVEALALNAAVLYLASFGAELGWMVLAAAIAMTLGYALAMPLLVWESNEARNSIVFPTMATALSVIGAYFGPGLLLGWVFSTVFVPAHAGLLGWLVGATASTFLTVLLSRFVAAILTGPPWPLWATLAKAFGLADVDAGKQPRFARLVMWGHGVSVIVLLVIGHGIIGPLIFRKFGSDASYETAIAWLIRTTLIWFPIATLAGILADAVAGRSKGRRRYLASLWLFGILITAVDLAITYDQASRSKSGQWWIEYQKRMQPVDKR